MSEVKLILGGKWLEKEKELIEIRARNEALEEQHASNQATLMHHEVRVGQLADELLAKNQTIGAL